jgi:hypothetical protein
MRDLKDLLNAKIESADKTLGVRIEALKELVQQYQIEQKAATSTAEEEREKAAQALRESLGREIATGDENLRQHIDHQRDQIDQAFKASTTAISKAETATEKRFDSVQRNHELLQDHTDRLLPRELFDTTIGEVRERGQTNLDLIQALALRMTEMEARGGGEKDHAAELRSSLAIGIAAMSGIAAVAAALIALFMN